jgi:hypothetical protein
MPAVYSVVLSCVEGRYLIQGVLTYIKRFTISAPEHVRGSSTVQLKKNICNSLQKFFKKPCTFSDKLKSYKFLIRKNFVVRSSFVANTEWKICNKMSYSRMYLHVKICMRLVSELRAV